MIVHPNNLRSVVNDNGTISGQYDYEPYGKKITISDGKYRTGFIDKEKDSESMLGDHGVRKYDEDIGRFTSIDPLFEKYMGWNPYQYCRNNPVNFLDKDGFEDKKPDKDKKAKDDPKPSINPSGSDPSKSLGKDWEWRGGHTSKPSDDRGSWYYPNTGESSHPDLNHKPTVKPHWDYTPGKGKLPIRIDPETGAPLNLQNDNGIKTNDKTIEDLTKVAVGTGDVVVGLIILKKAVGAGLLFTPAAPLGGLLIVTP